MTIPWLDQLPELPLTSLRAEFMQGLSATPLLLEAEPGAGKSTLAPLWALAEAQGQVILVQPRILAAQAVAQRLASLLGEPCGGRVGYAVPYDSCVGTDTQLLVTTPGILLQRLLRNPELEGVGCVMLDEIHERSVNQDLLWALLQETQILRDDLQLVLMSATPDPVLQQKISHRIYSPGRCFPVSLEYVPAKQTTHQRDETIENHLLRVLVARPDWQQKTLLVFLSGWRDIENCAAAISSKYPEQKIFRLHSRVAAAEQKAALDPAQGPRIILSTNIAETSLTIADVTLVIDSGLVRRVDYEQRTGISRLRTARISMASAEQRRGRAGRVQSGHCIRLWSQDQPLAAADLPEIRATDYLPLALQIAHWGCATNSLPWLEAPNKLAMDFANQQLQQIGFIDSQYLITQKGKLVSELGTHPRIAALLLSQQQEITTPTLLLALALHFEWSDENELAVLIDSAERELTRNRQWQTQRKRWLSVLDLSVIDGAVDAFQIAQAFSDRIGFRQGSGRYRLNSGISVESAVDLKNDWAVFPIINPKPKGHLGIGLAVQLTPDQQRRLSTAQQQLVFKQNAWQQQTIWLMGGAVIDEVISPISPETIAGELIKLLRQQVLEKGFNSLQWSAAALRLLQRARLVAATGLLDLPDLSEAALVSTFAQWLQPFLTAQTRLDNLPWQAALEFYLGYNNCQQLAEWLPEKITLPSGRSVVVEFSSEGTPEVSAKLQEFFGCEQLELAQGKIPLKIHLLSPNGSPLAVTSNLRSFWQQAYPEVRKEMRGRYPRHPWPDNPLEHEATALTKKKLAQQQSPQ